MILDPKALTPEKQLELWLTQHGFNYQHVTSILKYCPQLLQHHSLEKIAISVMSNRRHFYPRAQNVYIRPFLEQVVRENLGEERMHLSAFLEEAIAAYCSDTLLESLDEMIRDYHRKLE